MKYITLIEDFLKAFPEFAEEAEREKEWWEGEDGEPPLTHIFFGDILNHFLVDELSQHKKTELLERLFGFMELMVVCDDVRVQEVLVVTILEYLGNDKKILGRARALMGPETLKASHEIEKFWGAE